MSEMKNIPYRIFKIDNEPIELHADAFVESEMIEVEFEVSFNGCLKDRTIGCRTRYIFKQQEKIVSSLTVYCYFMVAPDYVDSETKEGKLKVGKDFLRYLATISVGTARGIQHAKTQGTVLNTVVIPPINLTEMEIADFVLE